MFQEYSNLHGFLIASVQRWKEHLRNLEISMIFFNQTPLSGAAFQVWLGLVQTILQTCKPLGKSKIIKLKDFAEIQLLLLYSEPRCYRMELWPWLSEYRNAQKKKNQKGIVTNLKRGFIMEGQLFFFGVFIQGACVKRMEKSV